MFDANRRSTAETGTEYAAYYSNDTISNHLYTILTSMAQLEHTITSRLASFFERVPNRIVD